MLVETDESVTDVDYDCGFTDTAYFIMQSEAMRESARSLRKALRKQTAFGNLV